MMKLFTDSFLTFDVLLTSVALCFSSSNCVWTQLAVALFPPVEMGQSHKALVSPTTSMGRYFAISPPPPPRECCVILFPCFFFRLNQYDTLEIVAGSSAFAWPYENDASRIVCLIQFLSVDNEFS